MQFGGAWTEEKLGILERYLDAYTTALKSTPFKLVYIDAFAGTGLIDLQEDRDAGLPWRLDPTRHSNPRQAVRRVGFHREGSRTVCSPGEAPGRVPRQENHGRKLRGEPRGIGPATRIAGHILDRM